MRSLLFQYKTGDATLQFSFHTERPKEKLIADMKAFSEILSQAFKDVAEEIKKIESDLPEKT